MIRINLLPKEFEKKAAVRKKIAMAVMASVAVVLIFVGIYISRVVTLNKINSQIQKLDNELNELKPVVKKVNDFEKKKKTLKTKIDVIKSLMKSRPKYPVFMKRLAAVVPAGVWLTNLITQPEKKSDNLVINMSASGQDNYTVASFINALEKSDYFEEIDFSGISTNFSGGKEIRTFQLACKYIPEIKKKAEDGT